jgi:hypothetical protein
LPALAFVATRLLVEKEAPLFADSSPAATVARLAKFFPEATPLRLPVRLVRGNGETCGLVEKTVIEFGTPTEMLFVSRLPVEFGDTLRVENSDGSLSAEALVVALQHQNGRTAVAARFTRDVPNWIVKP